MVGGCGVGRFVSAACTWGAGAEVRTGAAGLTGAGSGLVGAGMTGARGRAMSRGPRLSRAVRGSEEVRAGARGASWAS